MGLLDYYRQFAGMSDEEITEQLREQAEEQRRRALARIDVLDLSRTTWHELPHPDVVNAVTYAARGALNVAADPTADELRRELGRRNGVEPDRVAVGHGAAQLLASAARALLAPGDELLTPWPSYGLYPVMAQRAGARAVPVPGGFDAERLLAAVMPSTRAVALCNPNDPTGEYLTSDALRGLLDALPEHVSLLLDEALADFVTVERESVDGAGTGSGTLALLDEYPRLLIFRTFSKIYGLAGLRVGFAVADQAVIDILGRVGRTFHVASPALVGAQAALDDVDHVAISARHARVAIERMRAEIVGPGIRVLPSLANFVLIDCGRPSTPIYDKLLKLGVIVRPMAAWGLPNHLRVSAASHHDLPRVISALNNVFA